MFVYSFIESLCTSVLFKFVLNTTMPDTLSGCLEKEIYNYTFLSLKFSFLIFIFDKCEFNYCTV